MHASHYVKAGIIAAVIVLLGLGSWELYLRNSGIGIDYDDGPVLWAAQREKVYQPKHRSTVFIGSSRIKYDLDIPTWTSITGEKPVQLAIEGSSPIPVLKDLANDENFRGKLVIDVTEGLFFSTAPPVFSEPDKNLAYYKDQTPSQRFSARVNHIAESNFYFLDRWNYSTNAMLEKLEVPSRAGVFVFPVFPLDFGRVTEHRQAKMTDRFLADTNLQNQVKGIWYFLGSRMKDPPPKGPQLAAAMHVIKECTDKIRSRGGSVVFVRTPSTGPFYAGESRAFPRAEYWDRLLAVTGCAGIHFKDDPVTANMHCPEFSHLSPAGAVVYTRALANSLRQQGWISAVQTSHP